MREQRTTPVEAAAGGHDAAGRSRLGLALMPWLMLVVGLVVTAVLAVDARRTTERLLEVEFRESSAQLRDALVHRLRANEQVLRGVAGLFDASADVTREDFRAYAEALRLEDQYPGILGVGFAQWIDPGGRAAHEAAIRREGFADYRITPPGERAALSAIVFLEPFSGRNLRAFGYDMFSEATRREAMMRARDSGRAAMSGPVMLVQETEQDRQTGFLLYLPVYRHGAAAARRPDRSAPLEGWAYSPIRVGEMIDGVLRSAALRTVGQTLRVRLYDGRSPDAARLMFDSRGDPASQRPPVFSVELPIHHAGRAWTLQTTSLPAFERRLEHSHAAIVATSGALLSLLLSGAVAAVLAGQRRIMVALAQTAEANRALAASEQTYRTLFDTMAQGVFYQHASGALIDANAAALELFGLRRDEFLSRTSHTPEWRVVREDGSPLPAEQHPSMVALRTGQAVCDTVCGVFNPRRGGFVWVSVDAIPLFRAGERQPYQVFVTLHDLSARKQAEQALQESERRLRDMVEHLPAGAIYVQGGTIGINAQVEALTGYRRDELGTLEQWFGTLFGERAAAMRAQYERDRDAGFPGRRLMVVRHKDGSERLVDFAAYRLPEGDIWLLYDVTEREEAEAALETSEMRLRALVGSLPDLVLAVDTRDRVTNYRPPPGLPALLGDPSSVLGRSYAEVLPAPLAEELARAAPRLTEPERRLTASVTLQFDGVEHVFEARLTGLFDGEQRPAGVLCVARDVTEERTARARDHLLVSALMAVGNGVVITDREARIEWANPAFEALTGYSRGEALHHNPAELIKSGVQDEAFYQRLWSTILAGQVWRGELVNRRKDGSFYDAELTVAPVRDERGEIRHFVGIQHNISERKRMEAELRDMAASDALTGLPNRRTFLARLEIELARQQRTQVPDAVVLMLDLDHFKRINDEYGHAAGDAVLRHFARVTREALRRTDMAGRIGGEEFAVLLTDTDSEAAQAFARRLRQNVADQPCPWNGLTIGVTVSIGVAMMRAEDHVVDAVLMRADAALYRAKSAGRNRVEAEV